MSGVVAVILAGGEARRLGGIDKTLITLDGVPVLSLILCRLRPQLDRIALSANGDPSRFAAFGLPVLADRRLGIGPLAGLLRGLDWAAEQGADALLTVPGDTPFIPPDLLTRLSPAPAVAVSADRRHHLVATWPVTWRLSLLTYLNGLEAGSPRHAYGARAFVTSLPETMREMAFAVEPTDPFFNVNTPADRLAAATLAMNGILPGGRRAARRPPDQPS